MTNVGRAKLRPKRPSTASRDQPLKPSLRAEQVAAVRERILGAALEVIEAGDEPTMRTVARAAGVAERTLYRYFGSHDELVEAITPRLRARASTPMADDVEGLPEYIRRLFTTFDQNAALVRTLITASWAPTQRTRSANLAALRRIVDAAFPSAPRAARTSATATLRTLYSASTWAYLSDCGFTVQASIRHVQWVTEVVLKELRDA
ncbi:MAG: helix-turn-helix domain-containing protein [Polyangiales bacterium]